MAESILERTDRRMIVGRSQRRSRETRTRLRGERNPNVDTMITVTFNVYESQVDALDVRADSLKSNRSAVLRDILKSAGV